MLALVFCVPLVFAAEPEKASAAGQAAAQWLEYLRAPGTNAPALKSEAEINDALDAIGADAIPVLTHALAADPCWKIREVAAQTLGRLGLNPKATIPALVNGLTNENFLVWEAAHSALNNLALANEQNLALLAAGTAHPSPKARESVIEILGSVGPGAKSALPLIVAALQHKKPNVRESAVTAIRQIVDGRTEPLSLAFKTGAQGSAMIHAPWLAGVTHTSVCVSVETASSKADVRVSHGPTAACAKQARVESIQPTSGGTFVHRARLTGLAPGSVHYYRVTCGPVTTEARAFTTVPLPGTAARWGFTADAQSEQLQEVKDLMTERIAAFKPGLMVYGGDLVETGAFREWAAQWFTPGQQMLNATIPFVHAPGHHEALRKQSLRDAAAYTRDPRCRADGAFSFDYGDAHILVLVHGVSGIPKDGDQWKFAVQDLAATKQPWKFVCCPVPAYAYGAHGGNAGMQEFTTQVLEPAGVQFVLCGHNHFYQHCLVKGLHHVDLGPYAAPLRPAATGPYAVKSEATFNFAILETTPSKCALTAYRADGSVIETIALDRDDKQKKK